MPASGPDYLSQPVAHALQGRIRAPGDKSISHRAVMLGALADGVSEFEGFLNSADTRATIDAFRRMGVDLTLEETSLSVVGVGLDGLSPPAEPLCLGNSGTSARLLLGLLAGQRFDTTLCGDESLTRRPMRRVCDPLNAMNAAVQTAPGGVLPARIQGNRSLRGIEYKLPVASAQLKSALLLAGLYARGRTTLVEPAVTRDHTERMLAHFARPTTRFGQRVTIERGPLRAAPLRIPGDLSSAAFFMVAACIVPGSDVLIEGVGVNPTRRAVIDILRLMGADLSLSAVQETATEPSADIRVKYSPLRGIAIPEALVPVAIDEFPAIIMAACYASGETILSDARELRVKESDRIQALADGLRKLRVPVRVSPDGLQVTGQRPSGGEVDSYGDHRIAMAFALAGLGATGPVTVKDCSNVDTSFPGFIDCAMQTGWQVSATGPHAQTGSQGG